MSFLLDLAKTLFNATVGRLFGLQDQRKVIRGQLRSLRAEINQSGDRARTYLESPYKAPAYRCPTDAYDGTFASLVEQEVFDEEQIEALREFYAQVVDFNRCLDQIQDAVGSRAKQNEANRAVVKAEHIQEQSHDVQAFVEGNAKGYR